MLSTNRQKWIVGVSSLVLGLGLWGGDILIDRAYRLVVIEPVPLYSLPPHEYPKRNPTIGTLKPEQAIRVLRLRYAKDSQTFQIETKDGVVGWVVSGKELKVIPPGSAAN
jgi:hypothetical protein